MASAAPCEIIKALALLLTGLGGSFRTQSMSLCFCQQRSTICGQKYLLAGPAEVMKFTSTSLCSTSFLQHDARYHLVRNRCISFHTKFRKQVSFDNGYIFILTDAIRKRGLGWSPRQKHYCSVYHLTVK